LKINTPIVLGGRANRIENKRHSASTAKGLVAALRPLKKPPFG
jgi:hypothetical protein